MIYTTIDNLKRYLGLGENLDSVIRFMLSNDIAGLPAGRTEIDGDKAFVNCFDYETFPREQCVWEGHANFGDIHLVTSGEELVGFSDTSVLSTVSYKTENDLYAYDGPVQNWVHLVPGMALVVFPEDAHMVRVAVAEPAPARKVCFKFKL